MDDVPTTNDWHLSLPAGDLRAEYSLASYNMIFVQTRMDHEMRTSYRFQVFPHFDLQDKLSS